MDKNHPAQLHRGWFGGLALLGVLIFFSTASVLQFVRGDYLWFKTPLSFYLVGPYNAWLHAGFFALAAAIALVAAGCYINSIPAARSVATLLIFGMGTLGVVVTAISPTDVNDHLSLHGAIHLLAAALAFLATSTGMLLQSWRFRQDPRWRPCARFALTLALVEFIWFWVFALVHTPVNGAMQKSVILLILTWLALVACWLMQEPRAVLPIEHSRPDP